MNASSNAGARLSEDSIRAALDELLERRSDDTRVSHMGAGNDDLTAGRDYLAACATGGWGVPTWPDGMGGRDATRTEAALIASVLAEYVVPDLYAYGIGLGMAGPALLAHGTEAQQRRWLAAIASGREIWCQMFSEPEAGSDLANVALAADRDGDEWVLSGQKTWTSRGMWAHWGICLARTQPELAKHKGLTMFAVPMDAAGIDVRPLLQMNSDAHFSEVFVDEARVNDDCRIGDVNGGWAVAMTVLAHERAASGTRAESGARSRKGLPTWLTDIVDTSSQLDAQMRDRLMSIHAADVASKLTGRRAAALAESQSTPGPAGSGAKLRAVRSYKSRAYAANLAAGPEGMLADADSYIATVTAPSMSIRGGTDEVQRNILGERTLGLPGEPRLDRDVPWRDSRKGVL